VWDRTRGQTSGAGSVATWIDRLAGAVKVGLITPSEAHKAAVRVKRTRAA